MPPRRCLLVLLMTTLASAACERRTEPSPTGASGSAPAPVAPRKAQQANSATSAAASPAPSASASSAAPLPYVPATADSPLFIRSGGRQIPAAQAERVLHVGDSMVPLVANYLRLIFWDDKRNYWVESRDSSSTLSWADERLLQEAMYKYDPQVVLISLGSNELFDPKPQRRAKAIIQLVKDTRGRPCMWIAPPAWKKDRGFIQVLKNNLGHCRYFDSTALNLPRMEDGRHPDWTGGHRWATFVWRALGGTEPVPKSTRGAGQ